MRRQNSGLIYVWIVLALGMICFGFFYYILIDPTMLLLNYCALIPGVPVQYTMLVNLWLSTLTWIGMIFLLSMTIWSISNSQKRDPYH